MQNELMKSFSENEAFGRGERHTPPPSASGATLRQKVRYEGTKFVILGNKIQEIHA